MTTEDRHRRAALVIEEDTTIVQVMTMSTKRKHVLSGLIYSVIKIIKTNNEFDVLCYVATSRKKIR